MALVLSFVLSGSLFAVPPTAHFSPSPNASILWIASDIEAPKAEVLQSWAIKRDPNGLLQLEIPPQTGRSILSSSNFGLSGQILLKGTGYNPETAEDVGRIRYYPETGIPKQGDGFFSVREAWADLLNSMILNWAGIRTARIVGIIDLHESHPSTQVRSGILARQFINQTRLSNLEVLPPGEALTEWNRAADLLFEAGETPGRLNSVQLYFYLLKRMAKTVARMQEIGFQHEFLHSQQVTLAGELVDNGTGQFLADEGFKSHETNPSPSYFNFRRQPLLMLNMFIRTHALTADKPARLSPDSETRTQQTHSLLGTIMKIDPSAARLIMEGNPEEVFWKTYRDELAALSEEPSKVHKARSFYSVSLEEFLSRNPHYQLNSQQIRTLSERFENTKAQWKATALPDIYVRNRILEGISMKRSHDIRHCREYVASLAAFKNLHPRSTYDRTRFSFGN